MDVKRVKATRRRLNNGIFHSVADLQAAINRFINENNQEPGAPIWTTSSPQ